MNCLKILWFLGCQSSALGGSYCDHGNKLMWGNYSSCTGTFFYIQLHSRNANHILGITEKKISWPQTQWKRHKPRFYKPSNSRRQCPSQHSVIQPRPPSFQRELQKLHWCTLTYLNVCMDQHWCIDVEVFLTLKHLDPQTHQHIGKKEYFSDWTKNERDSPCSVWNCNVYIFQPMKKDL